VLSIIEKEKKSIKTVTYIFCSDRFLLKINRQFLQHDYYTDIITFNLSEDNKEIEGEIYISIDRIRQNSKKIGVPFPEELLRIMIHGILHLCGYNDQTLKEKKTMTEKEDYYLLFFTRFT